MTHPIRSLRADRSEGAFDRALARAARSLVVAPLPAAVLDAQRPVAVRPWLRVETAIAAAVAIAVLVIGIAVGAPKGPGASAGPAFRTGTDISLELRSSGYSCRPGAAASPGRPRMEAIVCTATVRGLDTTVIVSEDPAGRVGEIHVSADTVGATTASVDGDRSELLESLVGVPFADPVDAAAARAWLIGQLPLEPGEQFSTTIDEVPVVLERAIRDGYVIVLGDLGAGGSAVPSR